MAKSVSLHAAVKRAGRAKPAEIPAFPRANLAMLAKAVPAMGEGYTSKLWASQILIVNKLLRL